MRHFAQTWEYNNRNQLTQTQTHVADSQGQPVSQWTRKVTDLNYGYNAPGTNNGQVTSKLSNLDPGINSSYTYDALGRLTGVTGGSDFGPPEQDDSYA